MASSAPRSCSFVLRIWIKGEGGGGRREWGGEVIHAPTGQRSAVHSLREVVGFIAPRLRAMGAAPRGLDRLIEQLGGAPAEAPS
jgi:hypothetical protein